MITASRVSIGCIQLSTAYLLLFKVHPVRAQIISNAVKIRQPEYKEQKLASVTRKVLLCSYYGVLLLYNTEYSEIRKDARMKVN